jgi:hypothetical protein
MKKTKEELKTMKDLICVKEFAYGSPKFFATQKTFLNSNIMCPFADGSQINKFAPSI